jgi:hypothetical protein
MLSRPIWWMLSSLKQFCPYLLIRERERNWICKGIYKYIAPFRLGLGMAAGNFGGEKQEPNLWTSYPNPSINNILKQNKRKQRLIRKIKHHKKSI